MDTFVCCTSAVLDLWMKSTVALSVHLFKRVLSLETGNRLLAPKKCPALLWIRSRGAALDFFTIVRTFIRTLVKSTEKSFALTKTQARSTVSVKDYLLYSLTTVLNCTLVTTRKCIPSSRWALLDQEPPSQTALNDDALVRLLTRVSLSLFISLRFPFHQLQGS